MAAQVANSDSNLGNTRQSPGQIAAATALELLTAKGRKITPKIRAEIEYFRVLVDGGDVKLGAIIAEHAAKTNRPTHFSQPEYTTPVLQNKVGQQSTFAPPNPVADVIPLQVVGGEGEMDVTPYAITGTTAVDLMAAQSAMTAQALARGANRAQRALGTPYSNMATAQEIGEILGPKFDLLGGCVRITMLKRLSDSAWRPSPVPVRGSLLVRSMTHQQAAHTSVLHGPTVFDLTHLSLEEASLLIYASVNGGPAAYDWFRYINGDWNAEMMPAECRRQLPGGASEFLLLGDDAPLILPFQSVFTRVHVNNLYNKMKSIATPALVQTAHKWIAEFLPFCPPDYEAGGGADEVGNAYCSTQPYDATERVALPPMARANEPPPVRPDPGAPQAPEEMPDEYLDMVDYPAVFARVIDGPPIPPAPNYPGWVTGYYGRVVEWKAVEQDLNVLIMMWLRNQEANGFQTRGMRVSGVSETLGGIQFTLDAFFGAGEDRAPYNLVMELGWGQLWATAQWAAVTTATRRRVQDYCRYSAAGQSTLQYPDAATDDGTYPATVPAQRMPRWSTRERGLRTIYGSIDAHTRYQAPQFSAGELSAWFSRLVNLAVEDGRYVEQEAVGYFEIMRHFAAAGHVAYTFLAHGMGNTTGVIMTDGGGLDNVSHLPGGLNGGASPAYFTPEAFPFGHWEMLAHPAWWAQTECLLTTTASKLAVDVKGIGADIDPGKLTTMEDRIAFDARIRAYREVAVRSGLVAQGAILLSRAPATRVYMLASRDAQLRPFYHGAFLPARVYMPAVADMAPITLSLGRMFGAAYMQTGAFGTMPTTLVQQGAYIGSADQ